MVTTFSLGANGILKITGENHVLVFSLCAKMEFDQDLLAKFYMFVDLLFLIQF